MKILEPPTSSWTFTDSGRLSAEENMAIDTQALLEMNEKHLDTPVLRFFQWEKSVITYGYLMDEKKVQAWAKSNGNLDMVRRPTGGGAVIHTPKDLSFSLLWPRDRGILPEKPRESYEAIHRLVLNHLKSMQPESFILYPPPPPLPNSPLQCQNEQESGRVGERAISVCFQEPVCNDVMLDGQKILGGALRLTRGAILYQGTLQGNVDGAEFKRLFPAVSFFSSAA